jgi:hypothetical protein
MLFFVSVNQVLVRLWTRRYGRCLTCGARDRAGSHIDCLTDAVCADAERRLCEKICDPLGSPFGFASSSDRRRP